MKVKTILLALAFTIPAPAIADDAAKKDKATDKAATLAEGDTKALAHVQHVNEMEIEMGKMAQKSGTAAVKKYGEMLVKDHSDSAKKVKDLAKQKKLAKVPPAKPETEAEKADHDKQMKAMADLKKMKGADFDREYLRMMVEGHDKELAKTPTLVSGATDADVKTLLENRKTTLQKHADTARELQKGNAQASSK